LADECDDRLSAAARGEQCGGELGYTRALGRGTDAWRARRTRPAVGHPASKALVANFVKLDAELVELFHPIHIAVDHQPEYRSHAFLGKGVGQSFIYLHFHSFFSSNER